MAKKNTEMSDMIDSLITTSMSSAGKTRRVVDIITFCENPAYLGLMTQDPPVNLWPMQKIVLKIFYRGTEGNKHIQLDESEIAMLNDIADNEDLDYNSDKGGFRQIIHKYERGTIFDTLMLIMGRRSSKTAMVSFIAAYEAYKLLEKPEGNPHKFYKLPADKPIAILNVAASESQAYDPLFLEIQNRIVRAPYFADKINTKVVKKGEIHLLTDNDKRENVRRISMGLPENEGSIVLKSGHSNSRTLRGQAAIAVLFDEFAHFLNSAGTNSGDECYNALVPSVKQFGVDGKTIMISDPKGRDGVFWRLFKTAEDREEQPDGKFVYPNDNILALQLPTWRVNPTTSLSRQSLDRERNADPIAFMSSWGAKFMGEQGSKFFDERKIVDCTDMTIAEAQYGDPKYLYHLHLDPASTDHNYALCLVHAVNYITEIHETRRKIFVDYIRFWRPTATGPVNISEVERCIRDLCRRFRIQTVTFDQFQSASTIQRLRACGVNATETRFTGSYIKTIYSELRNLMNQDDLVMYPHPQLQGELKNLEHKVIRSGFQKFPDKRSFFPTDDCCDALAGAVYMALQRETTQQLPRTQVVHFPRH